MNLTKYPRTFHLPWSPGATSDDKVISDVSCFNGKRVIVTEKMDGENTTLTSNACYARSLNSRHHPSRSWVKQFHAGIKDQIPRDWRICGENLYAKHSIGYDDLESYFYCFGIWDENNYCLSWAQTVDVCAILGITCVPLLLPDELLWGESTPDFLKKGKFPWCNLEMMEGYVVRNSGRFHNIDFSTNVAKYVRANHVQTDEHWMNQPVVPNKLL
jgi:hypothetical protein